LTVGQIAGGAARNVIADTVCMRATLRTLNAADARRALKLIRRTAAGVCRARGATFHINVIAEYPPLVNTPAVNRLFERTAADLFGKSSVVVTERMMGGEDFACYLEHAPGAMFRLGVRNARIGATEMWHSDRFMIDEEAIYYGTALLALSAIRALADA
ncbi:MAG: M20/M25/M40 family metallo-hydrolase, partial [Candidatus Zixiibacteriota bacterium]